MQVEVPDEMLLLAKGYFVESSNLRYPKRKFIRHGSSSAEVETFSSTPVEQILMSSYTRHCQFVLSQLDSKKTDASVVLEGKPTESKLDLLIPEDITLQEKAIQQWETDVKNYQEMIAEDIRMLERFG